MILEAKDIRNVLKPFDSGWFNKVSNTNSILDTHYEEVSDQDREKYGNMALDAIVSIIKKSDHKRWKDLTRDTLYEAFRDEIADCDDWTAWYVDLFKLFWSLNQSKQYEPALFRLVIQGPQGPHAVAGFFYKVGIIYLDPQNNNQLFNQNILAVT